MTQKELIEGLINVILTTEEEESVSNLMVGRIFDYLNKVAGNNTSEIEDLAEKANTPVMTYLIKPLMKDTETGGLRLRYSRKNLATDTVDNSVDNSVIIPVATKTMPGLMSPEMLQFSTTVAGQWEDLTSNVSQLYADMYEGGGTVPMLQADVDNLMSDMYEPGCIVPQLQVDVESLKSAMSAKLTAEEAAGIVEEIWCEKMSENTGGDQEDSEDSVSAEES